MNSGGVRGIVELYVLKHIEVALGGKLPLQLFFDLIVGTRRVHLTRPASIYKKVILIDDTMNTSALGVSSHLG